MVAVVVILAAVIGAFVLGLGGSQDTAPQAAFSYDSSSGVLTMESGENITASALTIYANGAATQKSFTGPGVTAGDTATLTKDLNSVRIVWASPESDKTATIWESS